MHFQLSKGMVWGEKAQSCSWGGAGKGLPWSQAPASALGSQVGEPQGSLPSHGQCNAAGLGLIFALLFGCCFKICLFFYHHKVCVSCLSFSSLNNFNLNSLLPLIPIFWLLFSFCLFSELPPLPLLGRMNLNQCFLIFLLCLSLRCMSELLKILFRLENLALFRGQNSPLYMHSPWYMYSPDIMENTYIKETGNLFSEMSDFGYQLWFSLPIHASPLGQHRLNSQFLRVSITQWWLQWISGTGPGQHCALLFLTNFCFLWHWFPPFLSWLIPWTH